MPAFLASPDSVGFAQPFTPHAYVNYHILQNPTQRLIGLGAIQTNVEAGDPPKAPTLEERRQRACWRWPTHQFESHPIGLQAHAYMPHWPQPGLVPRSEDRGDIFRNVRYFGERENLLSEISSSGFGAWCRDQDLGFQCVPRDLWHQYGDSDAVLAVRSITPGDWSRGKPASKLVNACLPVFP